MKTITIRLPDVEAATLLEVQKRNKEFRNRSALLARVIQKEFGRSQGK